MRVMAFDIGDVRCGVAVSDPAGKVASPVCVLPTKEVLSNAKAFRRTMEDWEPEHLLFGLPVSLDGQENAQAAHIRSMAVSIADITGLGYSFADERLSSSEAKRTLREMGYDEKSMRGKVDMIAAGIFLQTWLDSKNGSISEG